MVNVHKVAQGLCIELSKEGALFLKYILEDIPECGNANVPFLHDGCEAALSFTLCSEDIWMNESINFTKKKIEIFINMESLDDLKSKLSELITHGYCRTPEFASFPAKNNGNYLVYLIGHSNEASTKAAYKVRSS
jgi:hypothetical protein